MALRFVRGERDAEDISQEAFLRDWPRRNRKPARMAVAIDDASDFADGRVDLEQGLLAEEEKEKVRAALDGLYDKYRAVLVLHYYERMWAGPGDVV
jgi:DNA-directed RNA polymerase specialized sigma24 family protein